MTQAPYEADRPTSEIAEDAVNAIEAILDEMDGTGWAETDPAQQIRHITSLAYARLRMARMVRNHRGRRRLWLAKVTSFAFPRQFARQWGETAANHLCFTVEVTDGGRAAVGRQVEVQIPDEDAERLAHQILRLVEWRKKQNPGLKEDQVT